MKRTAWKCVLGLTLAVPASGCLPSLSNSFLEPEQVKANSIPKPTKKEAVLPNKETADICITLGQDLEKNGFFADAIVQYEKARQLDSKYKVVGRRLAVLYDRAGDEQKALVEFGEAIKRTPKDPDLLNDVGYCHYNRGRWPQAESYFRQAIAINPDHHRAWNNLGMTLGQQTKYDESYQAFLKVNRPAQAKANIAFVMATQGKKNEALEAYRDALRAEPGLTSAKQAMELLEKGGKPDLSKGPADAATLPCAGLQCDTKSPSIDNSPITIGPKRDKKTGG